MRLIPALTVIVLGAALAGCGGDPETVATKTYRGIVEWTETKTSETAASWVTPGSTFAITTWGSSSCPDVPVKVEGTTDSITVAFESNSQEACTADLAPTTHEFPLPKGTREENVSVQVKGLGKPVTLQLP